MSLNKVVCRDGKDKGLPYWRVSIRKELGEVILETENFDHGFWDGEDWDKVSMFRVHSISGIYELRSTVITKHPERMEEYKTMVIEKLYEIAINNIKSQKKIVDSSQKVLNGYQNLLKCDLFKGRIREEKLDKLL